MSKKFSIDIIIPSVKGSALLAKNLPQVLKYSKEANQIIVVDDGKDSATQTLLSQKFPQVKIVTNDQNLGFPKSVNKGFQESKADLIVLLNNDVLPEENYLKNALKHFKNKKVFAVTFNEKHSSYPVVSWGKGKLQFIEGQDKSATRYSAWASGGSAIFRKKVWDKLNGFNELYSPGYWEDIEIGWRAWKAGYQIIWEPSAKVIHEHESTFKKLDPNFVSLIKQRNELLFTWQNITSLPFRLSHLWFLFSHTLTHLGYLKIFLAAFTKYHKLKKIKFKKLSDKKILAKVNGKV